MSLATGAVSAPAPEQVISPAWRRAIPVFAAAAFTIVLFALTPVTTRIAGSQLDGETVGLVRAVGAGLFAIPLIAIFRVPAPADVASWSLVLVSALGSFAGFPLLFSLGAQHTSATHVGLIMASMPLMTGTIALIVERRRPRQLWFIGTLITLGGEALLMTDRGGLGTDVSGAGDALVLAACILCACGFVAGGRLAKRISPLGATLWAIAVASAVLLPAAAVQFGRVDWADLSSTTYAAVLHITLGASVLAYISWFWALSRGGIARVAALQFAQPIVVLVLAALLLNEPLRASMAGPTLTILAGIALTMRG
jgi:drug/metabolite transporter (DMT)-like permease